MQAPSLQRHTMVGRGKMEGTENVVGLYCVPVVSPELERQGRTR